MMKWSDAKSVYFKMICISRYSQKKKNMDILKDTFTTASKRNKSMNNVQTLCRKL